MKKVLLTGSTGFVGRNITPLLRAEYDLFTPTRAELNLQNFMSVRKYLEKHKFDAVIHCANPTGENPADKKDKLFEDSMRVFMSLENCAELFGMMLYLGSGAEYCKQRSLDMVTEESFGETIPQDPYGLSRYLMNRLADTHDNIINLRVFGCYGLTDPPYKFIPYILGCIRQNREILLNQNAMFDFLYVTDIFPVIKQFLNQRPKHKAYNLVSGTPVSLKHVAEEVKQQTNSDLPISFKISGKGLDYTASNALIKAEIPDFEPTSMREGIRRIIEFESRAVHTHEISQDRKIRA